jgi:hypothetical protein
MISDEMGQRNCSRTKASVVPIRSSSCDGRRQQPSHLPPRQIAPPSRQQSVERSGRGSEGPEGGGGGAVASVAGVAASEGAPMGAGARVTSPRRTLKRPELEEGRRLIASPWSQRRAVHSSTRIRRNRVRVHCL